MLHEQFLTIGLLVRTLVAWQDMRDVRPTVSVVVPVFNSEATLPLLVQRLRPVLASCASAAEVILVNDGSGDRSWEVICELAARQEGIRGICLMRNYGQHNALLCGIRAARHEIIVTMDDDLQHPPEEIPKLLDKLAEGYDVVYGTPLQPPHGFWRNLASRITKLALQSAVGAEVARHVSAFRAFRTPLREAFANYHGPFVSFDVLLAWGGGSVRRRRRSARSATGWDLPLHLRQTRHPRAQHDAGLQHVPAASGEPDRLRRLSLRFGGVGLRRRALSALWRERPRLSLFGLGDRDLLRGAIAVARHHRRISGPDALPSDGPTGLCAEGSDFG